MGGVAQIETDYNTGICRFIVTDSSLDWQAKLDELAKTNEHITGFSVMPN